MAMNSGNSKVADCSQILYKRRLSLAQPNVNKHSNTIGYLASGGCGCRQSSSNHLCTTAFSSCIWKRSRASTVTHSYTCIRTTKSIFWRHSIDSTLVYEEKRISFTRACTFTKIHLRVTHGLLHLSLDLSPPPSLFHAGESDQFPSLVRFRCMTSRHRRGSNAGYMYLE